jgi:hypothetical protein
MQMTGGMQNAQMAAATPAARINLSRNKDAGNHVLREQRINMLQDQEFLAKNQKLAQFIYSSNAEAIQEKAQKEALEKHQAFSKKFRQSQKSPKQMKKKQKQVEQEEEYVEEDELPEVRKVKNIPSKIKFNNAERGEAVRGSMRASAPETSSN